MSFHGIPWDSMGFPDFPQSFLSFYLLSLVSGPAVLGLNFTQAVQGWCQNIWGTLYREGHVTVTASQKGYWGNPTLILGTIIYFSFLFSNKLILIINFPIFHPMDMTNVERQSYQDYTLNRRALIQNDQDLFERVSNVLAHMKALGLDLPILLHVLSWGGELLTTDGEARYHQGVLMNSRELPEIVQQWNKQSEMAWSFLTLWAIDHVTTLVNAEMDTMVGNLCCDRDDLSEETFLSITPNSMVSLLKPDVLTLWRILKSASRTSQQKKQNKEGSEKVWVLNQADNCVCLQFAQQNILFVICQLAFSQGSATFSPWYMGDTTWQFLMVHGVCNIVQHIVQPMTHGRWEHCTTHHPWVVQWYTYPMAHGLHNSPG